MYTSILYVLDHCFYLPLNHLFLSTIVPEQLYCNEKVIFCYKQIDSTRIAGGFCVSGISIFRNTKNSNTLNRINPIRKLRHGLDGPSRSDFVQAAVIFALFESVVCADLIERNRYSSYSPSCRQSGALTV